MSMSDNIADMLTRIRNAQNVRFMSVAVFLSKMNSAILLVLKNEGYIRDYKVDIKNRAIEVELKYSRSGDTCIKEISRVSRPGQRLYSSVNDLFQRSYYNNMGIRVLSTSRGVISDREAQKMNVGGEVLCKVF